MIENLLHYHTRFCINRTMGSSLRPQYLSTQYSVAASVLVLPRTRLEVESLVLLHATPTLRAAIYYTIAAS